MTDRASLGHWVRRFLLEYAASERNLSPNTRASYRDMLVLLLPFVAKSKGASVDKLAVSILGQRERGRWRTTQESSYALFALAASESSEGLADRRANVYVNGEEIEVS